MKLVFLQFSSPPSHLINSDKGFGCNSAFNDSRWLLSLYGATPLSALCRVLTAASVVTICGAFAWSRFSPGYKTSPAVLFTFSAPALSSGLSLLTRQNLRPEEFFQSRPQRLEKLQSVEECFVPEFFWPSWDFFYSFYSDISRLVVILTLRLLNCIH